MGLSRPVDGDCARAVELVSALGLPVVAIDLPSGISGESGKAMGPAFRAGLTVTFARRKPGHLLMPGRQYCGEVALADIGISDAIIEGLQVQTFVNCPELWLADFPVPGVDTHKYRRGHACVFSGGPASTGAARQSALAAARGGAGAVTVR